MVWEDVVATGGSPTDVAKPPRFVAMGDPWISPIHGYINGAVNGVCSGDSLKYYLVSPMMNRSPFTPQHYSVFTPQHYFGCCLVGGFLRGMMIPTS